MTSRPPKRSSRAVNIFQFGGIFVAVVLIASLIGTLTAGLVLPAAGAAGAIVRAVPDTFRELPSELEVVQPSEESRMLDSEGRVMARFYSERRIIVPSDQIAPVMKNAIIAVEDRRFMTHHGIDPEGMVRAVVNNLTSGKTQGASTITQQYVKNMLMERGLQAGDQDLIDEAVEVSAERKLREARYAISLESQMTKEEILTGYLNLAAFGTNIYGVEAASRAYFSKSANELTAPEAALLAGTVQSPVEYDPLVNPEAAQSRRNVVLEDMLDEGFITEEEYEEAHDLTVEETLNPQKSITGCEGAGTAAYFCTYAVEEFLKDEAFGEDRATREHLLNTGGLTLRTTLENSKQNAAYQAVVDRVPVGDPSGMNTTIVSIIPQTGDIVAMAQNTPYGIATESNPYATQVSYNVGPHYGGGSGFQPGSTFKMFTLVEWFANGHSAYESVGGKRYYGPGDFTCHGEPIYTEPWNVGDLAGKDGAFNIIQATQKSINQVFVAMVSQMDLCSLFDRAASMGVTGADGEPIEPFAPNILGSTAVPPIDMASAYGTIADDGILCTAHALVEVEDRDGNILKSYKPECSQVVDPTVAKQVAKVLEHTGNSAPYDIGRPQASKTGTTDNNSNTWVVGFTPQLVTAAWAGFGTDSSRSGANIVVNGQFIQNLYGGYFVGPMWAQYMSAALEGTAVEGFPDVFIGNAPQPAAAPTPAPVEEPPAETENAPSAEEGD